jgi:hypothetical protein
VKSEGNTKQLTAQREECPSTLATAVGGNHTDSLKNTSLYNFMMQLFFAYNKPEVEFMHNFNHIEHYTK